MTGASDPTTGLGPILGAPTRAIGPKAQLDLPAGYASRPLRMDDADAVTQLVADCEQHDFGEVLIEIEDIIAAWQRPSTDLASQTIGVFVGGQLAAAGEVSLGRRAEVYVHPSHRGRGIGAGMLRWTWDVARASGGTLVGQTVHEKQSDAIALFREHGYEKLWTSWILELPEGAEIRPADVPAGTLIRTFRPGQDERAAYAVVEDAFNEWPNRDPVEFEDWAAGVLGRPGFEPWQLLLAVEGPDVVGVCFVSPSEDTGWVQQIAVRRDQRGRGLGRALLVRAFAESRARGATRAELSTDSRTGALGLYEHVGMRVKQSFAHWARRL